MCRPRLVTIVLASLALAACAAGQRSPGSIPVPAQATSGFLDDYSLLREGGPGEALFVYRNPDARWQNYDKALFEPVTLWRSGKGSLDPVPEGDLLRLATDFDAAVRTRLGDGFALVDRPGPGVMRVRLAITEARASDPVLDVMTVSAADGAALPVGDGALGTETRRFLDGAAIEGEIRDAQTGALLAAGVDRRRPGAPEIDTWKDVDRLLASWADRVCSRLEARVKQQ